jgi:hypothetical protein
MFDYYIRHKINWTFPFFYFLEIFYRVNCSTRNGSPNSLQLE